MILSSTKSSPEILEQKIKPPRPKTIHCLGLNYPGVGESAQAPLYFIKSSSSLCFEGAVIKIPEDISKVWTEVELGIWVRKGSKAPAEDPQGWIAGYTVCADLTCSNLYDRDHHLAFSKSRKGFCPVLNKSILLYSFKGVSLHTFINGKETQTGKVTSMILSPPQVVKYLSGITELEDGDLILTGTPPGVENNLLKKGDKIRHLIDGVGELWYQIMD